MEKHVREQLERFLSWLLDVRWFPEVDSDERRRHRTELRKLRRILARMEAFTKGVRDMRLDRGLAEWRNYEGTLASLAAQHVHRAPHMKISGGPKGSPEIARRIMCAVMIIRKLTPDVSAYAEAQRLLADPTLLPYPITVPKEVIQKLRAVTIGRPTNPSELSYIQTGRDIPMRPYSLSVKPLESAVHRLREQIEAGKEFSYYKALEKLFAEYLWSQCGRAGFSEAEAEMLSSLISAESESARAVAGGEDGARTRDLMSDSSTPGRSRKPQE